MNRLLRALLCGLLACAMLMSLCACGGTEDEPDNPIIQPEDYDPDQSYHITQNADKTYTYWVADATSNIIFSKDHQHHQPTFEKVNEDLLLVTSRSETLFAQSWAIFCNVKTAWTSSTFSNYVLHKGTYVAHIEFLTNAYHVFVRDIFNEQEYLEVVTLTDLQIDKDGNLFQSAKLNKDGNLEIVYTDKKGEKTALVKMP